MSISIQMEMPNVHLDICTCNSRKRTIYEAEWAHSESVLTVLSTVLEKLQHLELKQRGRQWVRLRKGSWGCQKKKKEMCSETQRRKFLLSKSWQTMSKDAERSRNTGIVKWPLSWQCGSP